MKRFKYRLERVLEYRKLLKDEKVRELLIRNQKLNDDNERLRNLQLAELLNRMEANAVLSAAEVELLANYGYRLRSEISTQKDTVHRSEEAVAEATEEYIEAAKDEKTLETHKERKLVAYGEYVQQEEEKFVDELNIQRTGLARRSRE